MKINSDSYSSSINPLFFDSFIQEQKKKTNTIGNSGNDFASTFAMQNSNAENLSLGSNGQSSENLSIVESVNSGNGLIDAISEYYQEKFEEYFNEALAKNGGDVSAALESAKNQVPALADDYIAEIVEKIAQEYASKADEAKDNANEDDAEKYQNIADMLYSYAEELKEENTLHAQILNEQRLQGKKQDESVEIPFSKDEIRHGKNIEQEQENNSFTSLSHAEKYSNEKLNEQEKREKNHAIKQYNKAAYELI